MSRWRRTGLILILAAALGTASFAVYARTEVDYDALVTAHNARMFVTAGSLSEEDRARIVTETAALTRYHQGTPPCLSHAIASDPPEDERAQIQRDLEGAQLLPRLPELSPLFFMWGDADERRRHGLVGDEEALAPLRTTSSVRERAILFFASHGVADAVRANDERARAGLIARAEALERTLTAHELESLWGIWLRHPVALSFPNFVRTSARLSPKRE